MFKFLPGETKSAIVPITNLALLPFDYSSVISMRLILPYDLNKNGKVDLSDFTVCSAAYGSKSGEINWNPACDFNNNGIVDDEDMQALIDHYEEVSPLIPVSELGFHLEAEEQKEVNFPVTMPDEPGEYSVLIEVLLDGEVIALEMMESIVIFQEEEVAPSIRGLVNILSAKKTIYSYEDGYNNEVYYVTPYPYSGVVEVEYEVLNLPVENAEVLISDYSGYVRFRQNVSGGLGKHVIEVAITDHLWSIRGNYAVVLEYFNGVINTHASYTLD